MVVEHVAGKKVEKIMLYALSTCGWCSKTKDFLKSLGVEFDYVYVDLLEGSEQEKTLTEVERWNPKGSFPTIVIGNRVSIVGFHDDKIREALKL